jgi:hypothetical protein
VGLREIESEYAEDGGEDEDKHHAVVAIGLDKPVQPMINSTLPQASHLRES